MVLPAYVSIGAKIAASEAKQIRELIETGVYLNDLETAKKEILGYFKSRGEAYPDEASEDLCLDYPK